MCVCLFVPSVYVICMGSVCSSDNYRGISLSNSICKLFDYVFIHTHKDSLQTCDLALSQII